MKKILFTMFFHILNNNDHQKKTNNNPQVQTKQNKKYEYNNLLIHCFEVTMGYKLCIYKNIDKKIKGKIYNLMGKTIGEISLNNLDNKSEEKNCFGKIIRNENIKSSTKIFISKTPTKILVNDNDYKFYSPNIYFFLELVESLINSINSGFLPDFYFLENGFNCFDEEAKEFYKMLGILSGKTQMHSHYVYMNKKITIKLSDFITNIGCPAYILHSGDGNDILVYFGIHTCPQDKKIYTGILLLQIDKYSIIRKILKHFPICQHCFKEIKNNNYLETSITIKANDLDE